jgi:site-specific DNA recombinase
MVGEYVDNDISATTGRTRPAWRRLLADIQAHKVDAVVAYSSSRMYRRIKDLGELIDLTKQNGGVEIATVASGDVNLNTADGIMLANILASIDQGEAMRTGERVSRKHEDKARAGDAKSGGRRPYGYEWDQEKHTWAVLPEEAKVVRRITKDLLHGHSLVSVVHALNVDGIKTAQGAAWNARGVKRMVLSPTIAGIRVHERTGTSTKGTWKGIITPQQHELLVAVFQDPTRPRRGGGPTERKRLLSGLLVCGKCGHKLYGDGKTGYSCRGKANGGCGNVRISANGFEDHVWLRAVERVQKLERAGALSALPAEEDEAAEALIEERLGLQQRRDELAGKYAEGVLDERQLTVGTAKIDQRVRTIDEQLAASVRSRAIPGSDDNVFFVPVPRADRNFTAKLEPKELLERSELLRALIKRIEVGPASGRGVRFEPGRLRITWRKSGTLRFPQMA